MGNKHVHHHHHHKNAEMAVKLANSCPFWRLSPSHEQPVDLQGERSETVRYWLNVITSISGTYSSLGSVVILDLSDNELRELPVALLEMERLKILDVSKNKLSGEGSLMRFDTSQWHGRHTLAEFIANQNEFVSFPPFLLGLTALETLS